MIKRSAARPVSDGGEDIWWHKRSPVKPFRRHAEPKLEMSARKGLVTCLRICPFLLAVLHWLLFPGAWDCLFLAMSVSLLTESFILTSLVGQRALRVSHRALIENLFLAASSGIVTELAAMVFADVPTRFRQEAAFMAGFGGGVLAFVAYSFLNAHVNGSQQRRTRKGK